MDSRYKLDEEYIEKRNEALVTGGPEALREVMAEYGNPEAATATKRIMEITFHKIRVKWRECTADLMQISYWWLIDHGQKP